MNSSLEIRPLVGVGRICLGLDETAVRQRMGEPDAHDIVRHSDGSRDRALKYEEAGLEFTFSSDDNFRLGTISVSNPAAVLGGRRLIGLDEQAFLSEFRQLEMGEISVADDFDYVDLREYECASLGLSFWVCNAILEEITLIPEYDASGNTPRWPEQT